MKSKLGQRGSKGNHRGTTQIPRKEKSTSNVVLLPRRNPSDPGRLDLGGVVRIVKPRAADLSPSQRARGMEAEAQKRALVHARIRRFNGRRSDETDEAYALRRRHFQALDWARWAVLELEELKPTAEGEPSEHVQELEDVLDAVEAGQIHWQTSGKDAQKRRTIGAVREVLEWYRQRRDSHASLSPRKQRLHSLPSVDMVRDYACKLAPELAALSSAEWARALDRWPGLPAPDEKWGRVVFDLLISARDDNGAPILTGAKNYRSLVRTWDP